MTSKCIEHQFMKPANENSLHKLYIFRCAPLLWVAGGVCALETPAMQRV